VIIHRVREKRGHNILGVTLTNLDTVSLFLARVILILQCTKMLGNLAEHFNIVTWRWRQMTSSKCRLQTKTDF